MNQKIADLTKILTENNIKPSYQRIKIMEYLVKKRNHPAVDKIFNDLVKEIPTLSKATIYNTLDIFKKAKLVRVISTGDNQTRYDADVRTHGHFQCESCGRIYDFPVNIGNLQENSLKNFKIFEKNIYFKGICPECLDNNK